MTSKCIVDLGPGDGRKTVIPVTAALKSGRYDDVTVCLVDYSEDMLDSSEDYVNRTISRYGRRFIKNPYTFKIERIHDKFEDLNNNQTYQAILNGHDEREFLFYGTTAGNFDPSQTVKILYNAMLPSDRAQVGLHLYTEGHDSDLLRAYEGSAMEDVSFVGLRDLGFTDEDRQHMRYYAEITKRIIDGLKELGPLTIVRTFYETQEPLERGLITLSKGDRLQALMSIKYTECQVRQVFEGSGKFRILDVYKDGDIAIFVMERGDGK